MPDKITITYDLHPPSGVQAQSATAASVAIPYDAYNNSALRTAQAQLNEILTTWKDAIGDLEKSKEDPGVIGYGQGKASKMQDKDESDEE